MKRTDLAMELLPKQKKGGKNVNTSTSKKSGDIKISQVRVDDSLSKILKKPQGDYVTIESDAVILRRGDKYRGVSKALSEALLPFVQEFKSVLVVGLGNPNMTADSLGARVASKLMVTRHIAPSAEVTKLSIITPNVLGVTGIESFDVVAGVCSRVKPEVIIAVDSLASAAVSRIGTAFQISTAGITPGSGVSNHRATLNYQSLKIPVISMGVPLVVYASTIISDATGNDDFDAGIGNMVVTPKDIDLFVEDCADIVAGAINLTFF